MADKEPAEVTEEGEFVESPSARRKAIKELHEKNSRDRAETARIIKTEYMKIADSPAIADLLKKLKALAEYHTKIAKDGVGYRSSGQKDNNGNPIEELVYHTSEKRMSELDRSVGVQEAIDLLERQLAEPIAR